MSTIPSVGTVMTPCPHVIQVSESLLRARVMMIEHGVRHLPAQDGDSLLGILTDRDLKRALDPDLGLPSKEELFIEDAFVPGAYVVDEAVALDVVLEEMADQHIGSALVTRAGTLVGIVTATDACRLLCEHLRSLR